jgi:succinyl-CoA synthetase alpha subunit
MATGYAVRPNRYFDSVFLMGINQRLSRTEGVRQTAVLMASEQNKRLLAEIGVDGVEIRAAGASDLIVAVVADSQETVQSVLGGLDEALNLVLAGTTTSDRRTLEDGLRAKPQANLAVLTIPGGYVYHEVHKALDAGLNLFIFSSNVPVQEEKRLKEFARERHLLVMGPDCGTALINGVGLGFANAVRRGTIGAIGPAGTGLQEFTCQVHHAGLGISHAIGTGSHDLSDEIGGITTWMALDRLEADPRTEVIAIVAKPAGPKTRARLIDRLQACAKPAVVCLLGSAPPEAGGRIVWARTIDAAAKAAIRLSGHGEPQVPARSSRWEIPLLGPIRAGWSSEQQYLRGLFAGGTLCYQSQQMLRDGGLTAHSNAPLDGSEGLGPFESSREHTLIDMGDDVFTLGRLHPMIDGSLRRQRIVTESVDPAVAILLLDFILGYNASPDPVADVLEAIMEGQRRRPSASGPLTVVASVCGTEGDPQGLEGQVEKLRNAGVIALPSNASATTLCLELLGRR